MLDLLFIICAAFGGTVLVIQFALMLLGFSDDFDADLDADVDVEADAGVDGDHRTSVGDAADADFDHPDTVWLFQMLSLKGIVAALTFFGLSGLWARSTGMSAGPTILVASGFGFAAMYVIYWLMKQLYKLRTSGNVDIRNAHGLTGQVYVPVPAASGGQGKVMLTIQGRTMEYEAITDEAEGLATGEDIVVTEVLDGDRVRVARLHFPTQAGV
ncbi:hypothetical protein KOR34_16080 [Posidoniimonas corsicana]|uniref:NfeD-like C-terminal domain-containing protein n=1 Tax=Posidoniimonas corsicana TaxID=1938618 RepID=A0A5C5VFJ5_9BACT|nr:hypothetical protein [Posidoniimonas corsicana]TWT36669.1 hypothetical protein KOR34_16080 [Posidoniimonas corsicana]